MAVEIRYFFVFVFVFAFCDHMATHTHTTSHTTSHTKQTTIPHFQEGMGYVLESLPKVAIMSRPTYTTRTKGSACNNNKRYNDDDNDNDVNE